MSLSLKAFDEKIADLKQKKLALATKQAQQLSKYLSNEMGGVYSPQLAAHIIQEAWRKSSTEQKEKWLKAATNFHFTKPRQITKTNFKNTTPHQSNGKEKAQNHGTK